MTKGDQSIAVASLEFCLETKEPFALPPHPGSALRGMIQESIRNDATRFYRGFPKEEEEFWKNAWGTSDSFPRPFGIVTTHAEQNIELVNGRFVFSLDLYGSAILFWRKLIEQIQWWGEQSEHKEKIGGFWNGNFVVRYCRCNFSGTSLHENRRFTGRSPANRTLASARDMWGMLGSKRQVSVELISPLWIEGMKFSVDGQSANFDIELFCSRIVARVNKLNKFFGAEECEMIAPNCERIRATARLAPLFWEVMSHKKREGGLTAERALGLVGTIEIEGDLSEVGPLLVYGSWIGVGKGVPQSLGRYRVMARL